jgi:hypothetical protein
VLAGEDCKQEKKSKTAKLRQVSMGQHSPMVEKESPVML